MKTEKELLERRNKQIKYGVILLLSSIAFIPGIAVKLLYLCIETISQGAGEGIVQWYRDTELVRFFFAISPNISLESFTWRDLLACIIVLIFFMGIFSLKAAISDTDEWRRLRKIADDNNIIDDMRRRS